MSSLHSKSLKEGTTPKRKCLFLPFFRWVEKWLRRWRGVYCGHQTQTRTDSLSILTGICQETIRDLRSAKCAGEQGKSVLRSLKYDLECDAFNHSIRPSVQAIWLFSAILIALSVQW